MHFPSLHRKSFSLQTADAVFTDAEIIRERTDGGESTESFRFSFHFTLTDFHSSQISSIPVNLANDVQQIGQSDTVCWSAVAAVKPVFRVGANLNDCSKNRV